MSVDNRTEAETKDCRHLIEALIGYAAFCAISFLSQSVPLALQLMVISGILLPLAWGRMTGNWEIMGFTRRNIGMAIRWGLGAGVATSLVGFVTLRERSLAPSLGLELAIGIPLWLLLASPFQEFFFRGWLQPRCEDMLGKGIGLLVATAGFTVWHYCWPLAAQSSFPLYTLHGFVTTFGAGLIYGYSFQRTGSIVAPWLAHGFAGIMFVSVGAGSFIDKMP
jgi:membrane protease YdiL (CAAX protease family)